ncbi:MAG TPA: DUF1669 domain-containing protein [Anaerolinea thermolimosa]|uniref:phospholipase D n=1 Tax=Anaerolinea thermolimosa TaxID=229919 RepID=A0A3D1JDN5_9CHLR|nr:DUF1669 domain-containing protein [Anaerolinea thermolimosa]
MPFENFGLKSGSTRRSCGYSPEVKTFHEARERSLNKGLCQAIALVLLLSFLTGCEFISLSGDQPTLQESAEAEPVAVFFTSPGKPDGSQALREALLDSIASARVRIDVAMYNFSWLEAANALLAAAERGVAVRMVIDSDALDNRAVQRLQQGKIPLIGDRREGLMHNKFILIDDEILWSGSLNLTPASLDQDHNVFLRIRSGKLVALYRAEFEEMFTAHLFGGGQALPLKDRQVNVDGMEVEVCFAPDDRPGRTLVERVQGARERIDFLAYTFTRDDLRDAMIEAARRGVQVRGVFDADQSDAAGSDYTALRRAGLDVRLDGNPGLMHEKVLVIDGETVVTGSYNFTRSADETNDENLLIIRDAKLARQFEEEVQRIYEAAQ